MNAFVETASMLTPLSPESREALGAASHRLELPKGEELVRADTVCSHIYFIEKGLARTFYLRDGKDITDWISDEGTFSCSIVSFITRKPDIRNIELLEPSLLWSIGFDDLERLYSRHHDIERLGRLLVSEGLVQLQHRFDDLHFATALERYRKLATSHPTFLQRVPLGMIASYIGVTGETLSRIRAQR